jgi:hypothetical protein
MLRNALLSIIWAFLLFWVAAFGPLCWILRDGLGPNAVDSSGWQAFMRFFMTFFWGPISLLLLLVVGLDACIRERSRPSASE